MFKIIPDFPNWEINEQAVVRHVVNKQALKHHLNTSGYLRVWVGGTRVLLQRLMAHTFLGLDLNDKTKVVNHMNSNRLDNSLPNLEVVNTIENYRHRNENQKWGIYAQ